MIDSGICPWCQTIQAFIFYGRQRCQICGKPIFVTRDRDSCSDGRRTTNTKNEHDLRVTSTIIQEHVDYWNDVLNELLTMETELGVLGLEPRKMIAETTRRIERLTAPKPLTAPRGGEGDKRSKSLSDKQD